MHNRIGGAGRKITVRHQIARLDLCASSGECQDHLLPGCAGEKIEHNPQPRQVARPNVSQAHRVAHIIVEMIDDPQSPAADTLRSRALFIQPANGLQPAAGPAPICNRLHIRCDDLLPGVAAGVVRCAVHHASRVGMTHTRIVEQTGGTDLRRCQHLEPEIAKDANALFEIPRAGKTRVAAENNLLNLQVLAKIARFSIRQTFGQIECQLLRWRANIVGFEHAQIKMGHTRTPVTS
jgi:hypothetical protein